MEVLSWKTNFRDLIKYLYLKKNPKTFDLQCTMLQCFIHTSRGRHQKKRLWILHFTVSHLHFFALLQRHVTYRKINTNISDIICLRIILTNAIFATSTWKACCLGYNTLLIGVCFIDPLKPFDVALFWPRGAVHGKGIRSTDLSDVPVALPPHLTHTSLSQTTDLEQEFNVRSCYSMSHYLHKSLSTYRPFGKT